MPDKPDEFFVKPDDLAATVFALTRQPRSAWSFEVEVAIVLLDLEAAKIPAPLAIIFLVVGGAQVLLLRMASPS